jgi:hypothetical protein
VVCFSENTLQELLGGALSHSRLREAQLHLDACRSCRELLSELARSLSAPAVASEDGCASPEAAAMPTEPDRTFAPGTAVGRYVIARPLGAGGMGVVYAAHDPELDRVVAIKVLHSNGDTQLQQRLRREAQVMAQLADPNVVSVYDVGVFADRMFIAMEYVSGETLARWLVTPRSQREILDVFRAAGRGLAVAHAAGIVHRDFKPENVLIGQNGRARVGDFGLARKCGGKSVMRAPGLEDASYDDIPGNGNARPVSPYEPTHASALTAPGMLVGTPYYMAPELFGGAEADARSDQFSFCVALFTALYGQRPYDVATPSIAGSAMRCSPLLDRAAASRVPRGVHTVLRRGLSVDPRRRFASMDELLAALDSSPRRRSRWVVDLGAMLALVTLYVGGESAAPASCEPPALDPAQVWSADARASLGRQVTAATAIAADIAAWSVARAVACQLPPGVRASRLACLDSVLARLDAVAHAARANRDQPFQIDAGELLIDPHVCELPRVPRLMTTTSPELREVIATWLSRPRMPVPLEPAAAGALITRVAGDACASSLAHLLAADVHRTRARNRHLDEAQQQAERCGDDRMLAEVAIRVPMYLMESAFLSRELVPKLRLADATVQRVIQRDLTAMIDLLRGWIALRHDNLVEALARGSAAMTGFAARHRVRGEITAGLGMIQWMRLLGSGTDLAMIPDLITALRERAVPALSETDELVRSLDRRAALGSFDHGDIDSAHGELARLQRTLPNDGVGRCTGRVDPSILWTRQSRRVTGVVVDPAGRPVAGATVAADRQLYSDSLGIGIDIDGCGSMRSAITGPDGRFEMPDAVHQGSVIAELGSLRSSPVAIADEVTLRLTPTSRIEGRLDLTSEPFARAKIVVHELGDSGGVIAPVAPDGTFTVAGVPRKIVRVRAHLYGIDLPAAATTLTVHAPVVRGISLALTGPTRVVHVIARSTADTRLTNASVMVVPGEVPSMTWDDLERLPYLNMWRFARQIDGDDVPSVVAVAAGSADLFATMTRIPTGTASVCAAALPDDMDDPAPDAFAAQRDRVPVRCRIIADSVDLLTIEVPPYPRLH